MNNATTLEINKVAILHNLAFFKAKLNKQTKILVVIKAFAYGSDASILATILAQQKVDYLAVAYTQEGVRLRKAGIKLPILILHPQIIQFDLLIKHCLEPNLYSEHTLLNFIKVLKKNKVNDYPIHIKFNTGMNRLGFAVKDVSKVISSIKNEPRLSLKSVFSHLASSEDLNEKKFTNQQIEKFVSIKYEFQNAFEHNILFHILNTSGILNYPNAHFDMVRLGIGIHGFANDDLVTNKLKNVLTLKSVISQIQLIKKGETVGYNRQFIAKKTTKIASIPIGYADGFSRAFGYGKTYVTINNKKANVLGKVSMDTIIVDITSINCTEGDEVIIFDSQKKIIEMATIINTISYELLTMISQRVERILVI